MRLEDTTPAEFLFGQLANNLLKTSPENSQFQQSSSKKFNALHLILTLFDLVLIAFAVYCLLLLSQPLHYIGIIFLFVRSFFRAYSGIQQLGKFGPDMRLSSNRLYFFSISQILISYILFSLLSGLIFIIVKNVPVSTPLSVFESWITISVLMYIFLFADIQLVALGLGTGIINQSAGISSIISNFTTLSKIKGKLSVQLAILRIITWFSIYYVIQTGFWLGIFPVVIVFGAYTTKWERINTSSIFMEIRGLILSSKPAILPTRILDGEVKTQEIPASVIFPKQQQRKLANRSRFGKSLSLKKRSRIGNLQPIAVKSINKIAEAIKLEEESQNSHMVEKCASCGTEILTTTNFCPFCGHRQSSLM